MAELRLNKAATASSPSANLAALQYVSDAPGVGTNVKAIIKDESGNIVTLGGFATKDYRLIRVVDVLQGTTTFTPTTGAQALYVEMVGSGGAGGGVGTAATNSGAGNGGGGGAYSAVWVTGTLKTSYACVVGAGGTAGTAGANAGNAGNDSTFDSPSICTAKGGSGGPADTVAAGPRITAALGGAGGLSSSGIGDLKAGGGHGGIGISLAAAQAMAGTGGTSFFAGNSASRVSQSAGAGGLAYGGGGSGGVILSGGANVAGGVGADGLIRIWEFA